MLLEPDTNWIFAVNSVLAIGGVGGLAVGLAGREILENLFTGLIILSSSPFEVGDEVQFTPPSGSVSALPFVFLNLEGRSKMSNVGLDADGRWLLRSRAIRLSPADRIRDTHLHAM